MTSVIIVTSAVYHNIERRGEDGKVKKKGLFLVSGEK